MTGDERPASGAGRAAAEAECRARLRGEAAALRDDPEDAAAARDLAAEMWDDRMR